MCDTVLRLYCSERRGGGAAGDEQRPASEGRERRATDGCSEACLMKALTDGNDDRGARWYYTTADPKPALFAISVQWMPPRERPVGGRPVNTRILCAASDLVTWQRLMSTDGHERDAHPYGGVTNAGSA